MDFGPPVTLRNQTPPKASPLLAAPISKTNQPAGPTPTKFSLQNDEKELAKESTKPMERAKESSTLKTPSPSTPATSPVISTKGSALNIETSQKIVGDEPKPLGVKVPPELPPRPLSPKSKGGSAVLIPTLGQKSSDNSPPKPSDSLLKATSSTASIKASATQAESLRSLEPKFSSSNTVSQALDPKAPALKTADSKPTLASQAVALKGSGLLGDPAKAERTDELRPQIAPWTVFSDDPDKTLANEELRSQVAPWTSEPDPQPHPSSPPGTREKSSGSNGTTPPKESPMQKVIGMDAFFSGSDAMDEDEMEFENPLLSLGKDTTTEDGEEMFSQPSVTKKTWIGTTGRPSQVGNGTGSKKSPSAVGGEKNTSPATEKKPLPKKVIDYGEIFKPAAGGGEDDDFMNDPEFRDAPEFEW